MVLLVDPQLFDRPKEVVLTVSSTENEDEAVYATTATLPAGYDWHCAFAPLVKVDVVTEAGSGNRCRTLIQLLQTSNKKRHIAFSPADSGEIPYLTWVARELPHADVVLRVDPDHSTASASVVLLHLQDFDLVHLAIGEGCAVDATRSYDFLFCILVIQVIIHYEAVLHAPIHVVDRSSGGRIFVLLGDCLLNGKTRFVVLRLHMLLLLVLCREPHAAGLAFKLRIAHLFRL